MNFEENRMNEHDKSELIRQALVPPGLRGPVPTSRDDIENLLPRWRELLEYAPDTGLLHWRQMSHLPLSQRVATKRYGPHGRSRGVGLDGIQVSSAKVVWLLHHGRWPIGNLSRVDGDITNDRIENLYEIERPAPRAKSKGVARCLDRWQAYVRVRGVMKHLGKYDTREEAEAARAAYDRGEDLV